MTLLKRLTLCLGISMLLVSCSKETPANDTATASHEAAPATTTAPAPATTDTNACNTAPDPGPCKAQIEKFYFDQTTKKCTSFNYGGCQGTVPFETLDTCQSACEVSAKTAAIGCQANGMEYNVGDTWAQACNTCTCTETADQGPVAVCSETPCDSTTSTTSTTTTTAPAAVAPSSTMQP